MQDFLPLNQPPRCLELDDLPPHTQIQLYWWSICPLTDIELMSLKQVLVVIIPRHGNAESLAVINGISFGHTTNPDAARMQGGSHFNVLRCVHGVFFNSCCAEWGNLLLVDPNSQICQHGNAKVSRHLTLNFTHVFLMIIAENFCLYLLAFCISFHQCLIKSFVHVWSSCLCFLQQMLLACATTTSSFVHL